MFNLNNHQEAENQPELNDQAVVSEIAEIPANDIHTMPDKFLTPATLPHKKGKISWLILGSLLVVVLGGVIVTLVIFFNRNEEAIVLPGGETANLNLNLAATTSNQINANVNQNLDTAESRDARRLSDIEEIRKNLELYFIKNDVYPVALNNLLSEFLSFLPQNPEPGGEAYQYFLSSDQKSYQLTFVLESGAALAERIQLAAGKYSATPTTIKAYQAESQSPTSTLPNFPSGQTEAAAPVLSLDTDNDQLTDIEENLYHTGPSVADTDGDGFADASELLGKYNPARAAGAKLIDSGLIKIYQNPSYNYSLFYPADWPVRSLAADNREVIFTGSTGEFIEVIVQANPLGLSAYNWYLNQNPGADTSRLTALTIDGLPAVQTGNGLTTYLGAGSNIFIISYNVGTNQQLNFLTTYKLFLKSFIFIQEPASSTGATSTPAS